MSALRSGAALAATVAIGYAACSVVFWAWPELAMNFMNGLFHGLDFRKLQVSPKVFEFGAFFGSLAGITAWAFLLGAVYGAITGRRG